jgi:hypothetical protein
MNFNLKKSHDCHVLMTALLSVALRGIKTELVRDAVTSLCLFFNAIEQKVISGGRHCSWLRDHRSSGVGHGLYGPTKLHWCASLTA